VAALVEDAPQGVSGGGSAAQRSHPLDQLGLCGVAQHLLLDRGGEQLDGGEALGPDLPIVVALTVPVAFFGGLSGGQVAALVGLMLCGEAVTRLLTVGLRRRWAGAWLGERRAPAPVLAEDLLDAYAP
jgi:hypothetical protein